jgi:hypothetical protein
MPPMAALQPSSPMAGGKVSAGLAFIVTMSMPRKQDIKQFRQACREVGLTAGERYEASRALHAEKESGSRQEDVGYRELVAWLREWRDSWRRS